MSMDPISAIANAVGSIFETIGFGKRARYARLPQWQTASDFQKTDYTPNIIIILMAIVLMGVVLAIALNKK